MTSERRRVAGALGLALLFIAIASYHIDRPGLQADETLFVHGVWKVGTVELFTRVFGWRIPLMQMPYLGSLKSIIYMPIFALFGVSAAAVRLPMVFAAAGTIALTFLLLWRLRGERTAWIGGALLAVDPSFLFTTRCDWGPVALERILCVGGVLLFVQGRLRWGAFLFGLALWNKTTFLWTLIGLAVAMAIAYRSTLLRLRPMALVLALLCFASGAYPWIRYNVRSHGRTAAVTARLDTSDLQGKLHTVRGTLQGEMLYGYLMRDADVRTWPRGSATAWLLLAALGVAVAMRDRLALFFAITVTAAWLVMAVTKDAGSPHHVVLLWPWPHCVIALAAKRWRIFTAAAALGVVISAGVIVRHYVLIDRLGSNPPWSDAIYPLAEQVISEQPKGIFLIDWGIAEQIILFTRGQLPFELAFQRSEAPAFFAARPGWIFAGHVDTREAMHGVNAAWKQVPGFRRADIAFIRDRHGFPIFELFRYEPLSPR